MNMIPAHGKMHLAMDRLLISLLNTAKHLPDPLETAIGAGRWWAADGVGLPGKPRFDPALAEALRLIRAALQAALAGAAAPLPLTFRGDASDAILFEVLYAARSALAGGTLRTVRSCAGRACGRYFHDQTKNGSRRWCSLRCMERARAPRRRTISR